MNHLFQQTFKFIRKAYNKVFIPSNPNSYNGELNNRLVEYKNQEASDLIKAMLLENSPLMIARFGSVELKCLANYHSIKSNKGKFLSYIQNKIEPFWWDAEVMTQMVNNAGFFPAVPSHLSMYCELMLEDMQELDVLGSWLDNEKLFVEKFSKSKKIHISDLNPFIHNDPWTEALEGKKVLIVHPFEESIQKQYKKREWLFKDQRVLPEFELRTVKAVQSIGNNSTVYKDWFAALNYMKEKISSVDFDIAIIGCGAYGFPLAAHVKRIGKKAIHLGGVTQILFGIIGKRWEEHMYNKYISETYMNEFWTRPAPSEIPSNANNVEGGCYW